MAWKVMYGEYIDMWRHAIYTSWGGGGGKTNHMGYGKLENCVKSWLSKKHIDILVDVSVDVAINV